jgi:hypothetical protein
MMVRAILRGGAIRPLSPLPETWPEGQELMIEVNPPVSSDDWESWSREIDELAAHIPPEDFDRVESALAEADQRAKEVVRRQMGLP